MDIKEIQKIAEKVGGLVVVENGKPVFVVLSYDKFKEIDSSPENPNLLNQDFTESFAQEMLSPEIPSQPEDETVEQLNKEVLALQEEIERHDAEVEPRVEPDI